MRYHGPRRARASRIAALGLALAAAACAGDPAARRPDIVLYASGADLQSPNPLVTVHPLAKAVQKHVLLMTVAAYDSVLRPVPRLARWEWSADRTTLTLRLRPDVRWHDGVPTRAADVVWTLEMARAPAVAYPRARDLAAVTEVRALDSLTVRLRFARAQPTFPDVLTDLAVLPAHRFAGLAPGDVRTAPFSQAPLGNGPFAFVEHRPNQRWVFRRFEGFPADLGRPAFERLVIVVVDEPATKLAALTSGELDFAGISPAHARFVRENASLRAIEYPLMFVYGLVWNLRRPPFDEPDVRRAFAHAIDRRLVVDAYLYGFGVPAHGSVPPEHPWHESPPPVPYDPAAARRLLDAAGFRPGPDGVRRRGDVRLAFELFTVGSGDLPLEQMLQAQLADVGVAVTLRPLELGAFLARAQGPARDYDALVIGIPGDLDLGYVAALFDGRSAGPLAHAGYRSEAFDAALARVDAARTAAELEAAWREAQRILAADQPVAWLYHARGLQGANRRVEHARPDLRGELWDVTRWRIRGTVP